MSAKIQALICKQANRLTTLGKCYPVTIKYGPNDFESKVITLDNGVKAVITEDNRHCCGYQIGIAEFDDIEVAKECYLGQTSLTRYESQAICTLAVLKAFNISNPAMTYKIHQALNENRSLDFIGGFFETVKNTIKFGQSGDDWIKIALSMAENYMTENEVTYDC